LIPFSSKKPLQKFHTQVIIFKKTQKLMRKLFLEPPFALKPHESWKTFGMFLYCHHHNEIFPPAYKDTLQPDPKYREGRLMGRDFSGKDNFSYYMGTARAGFTQHAHRGLSTLSIVMERPNSTFIDHFDNQGGCARVGPGDCQYMCAGSGDETHPLGKGKAGIVHSEMFPLVHKNTNNYMSMLQLWIKHDCSRRFMNPTYKMMWRESIPVAKVPVPGEEKLFSEVKVIVGDYYRELMPFPSIPPPKEDYLSDPASQGAVYLINLPKRGATVKLPPMLTSTANRALYLFEGEGDLTKVRVSEVDNEEENYGYLLLKQGTSIRPDVEVSLTNEGTGRANVLVLAAEPVENESTFIKGPFVGATQADVDQAYADFKETKFGGWPWDRSDPCFERDAPRQSILKKGAAVEYPPGFVPPL
jgi:quercetin 2,3-dioxygenase